MNTPATSRYGSQAQRHHSTAAFGAVNASGNDGSQRQLIATFSHIFGENTQQMKVCVCF
jgi:hypothetical protein